MSNNITIRQSKKQDAQGILDIYYYWKDCFIDEDPLKRYYVLKNEFTLGQLQRICDEGLATVAVANDVIASFYFLNPYYDTGNLRERKIVIRELIDRKVLPNGKYAYSLLSSTHKDYQGMGLNNKTLHLLRDLLKLKYDYFVGVMSYDNTATHKSSLKMGWKHFGDIGIGLLAVIGTTDEKNKLLIPPPPNF